MSLGPYTAIYLAAKYPDTIGEYGLFLSGCGNTWPEYGSWPAWGYGIFIFLRNSLLVAVPARVRDWIFKKVGIEVNESLYEDMRARSNYRLAYFVLGTLTEIGSSTANNEGWKVACEGVRARACGVAGVLEDGEEGSRVWVVSSEKATLKVGLSS